MLAVVSVVGFVAFLVCQLTEKHPIIDLSLFLGRNFTVGTLITCVGYAVFFGSVVILPLWLQTQLGYTASWAGIVQAPSGLVALLFSPLAGRLVTRADARIGASMAFLIMAAGLYTRALLNSQASLGDFILPMLLQGAGIAFFFVSVVTITLDGITPQRMPAATSISNFLRITAAAFATSISTTMWDNRASLHQSRLAEASSAFDPKLQQALAGLHDLGLTEQQSIAVLTRGVIQQAYTLSSIDYFYATTWIAVLLAGVVWFTRRPRVASGMPVAAD
jgi:DHA2 family multidrug resistance protein